VPTARWLLDTNIVSELMRPQPDLRVLAWLDAQSPSHLYLCAVTVMEVRHGLETMPVGRRRAALEMAFADLVQQDFPGRILDLNEAAANAAGRLRAARERVGRSVDTHDTMIAGIAMANRMGIVTRNAGDFHSLDVPLVNPFDARS
jgi:predicted nucleic acid-binding protein